MTESYCNNCGHRNPEGANFCSACGAVLHTSDSEPATITFFPDSSTGATASGPEAPGADARLEQPDQTRGPQPLLIAQRGPNVGSRYELGGGTVALGRHPESDIFLDDVTVSRRHAEVRRNSDDSVVIRDLGSLNGTYVNGQRVNDHVLDHGDELQVGAFKLVFVAADGKSSP